MAEQARLTGGQAPFSFPLSMRGARRCTAFATAGYKANDLTMIQDAAGLRTCSSRKGELRKAHLSGVLEKD